MAIASAARFGAGSGSREHRQARRRTRRDELRGELLAWAREQAAEARTLAAEIPFLEDGERERIRRALVAQSVRRCLVPGMLSPLLGAYLSFTWAALGLLMAVVAALSLAAVSGLGPHLADGVGIGVGAYQVPLILVLFAGMAAAVLITVPDWPEVPAAVRRIRAALHAGPHAVKPSEVVAFLAFLIVLGTGVVGAACLFAVVTASAWGPHDRTAIALGCGAVAGLGGKVWSRHGHRAGSRLFGFLPRRRRDDLALFGLALCAASSGYLLGGAWRKPGEVRTFRRVVRLIADNAELSRVALRELRWYELRERAQIRRKYRMLGTIMRSHAAAALDAGSAADWERIGQSLVSGLVLLTDGNWGELLARHASIPRRDRWLASLVPRVLAAVVTGGAAVFLPMLPGLDHTAASSLRVFLAVGAVLALLPTGGGYDQVRTALSSALPWRAGK